MSRTIGVTLLILTAVAYPQTGRDANYDETKVPKYTLPDPLVTAAGRRVSDPEAWRNVRRPEILELFREHVYGSAPRPSGATTSEVSSKREGVLAGRARMKEVAIYFAGRKDGPKMNLLILVPAGAKRPVPLFLGLNFNGNHAVHADLPVALSQQWMRTNPAAGVVDNRATEKSRGTEASRWQVDKILARGYALATAYYGDIDPDYDDGFRNGVHPLFYESGQARPAPDEWGSIGAWAWGLSRALDYLQTDGEIDSRRIVVIGHSRLGKTALWAGAQDERFAAVISNDSGEGGAALARRRFGETTRIINTSFPHWFCDNFKRYNDREDAIPVDQHMLLALIAPRPLYVASAAEDLWADPRGEFLSALAAEPVYRLLGKPGLGVLDMPAVDHPVGETLRYHVRSGKHDVTAYDWERYLDFADKELTRSGAR